MNGSIRQRSKGTWQLRYDAPPDGTGRRRFIRVKPSQELLDKAGYHPVDPKAICLSRRNRQ